VYGPGGTVYGTLLNFKRERALLAVQMTQPPYKAPPQAPVLYVKTANTWRTGGAHVPVPAHVPEVEIGATLGLIFQSKIATNRIKQAQAAINNIASIVLMNDFSLPHSSYFRPPVKFKCLDGFLGIGAQAVALGDAVDLSQIQLEVRINGALKQAIDFSNLVRSANQLATDVGEFMTLRDGDVLMLGCDCLPGGGRPLAAVGDRIDISSPSHPALGILSNTLVGEVI
jgi:5-oxopent-3-ene-1,2,5-tricarboxylate decarboxylase/2-hydroxyhepta-2,4-diene-1,7-dioate isomerase